MIQKNYKKEEYNELVKNLGPKSNLIINCIKAYVVGGMICVFGQFINNYFISKGYIKDDASLYTSIILIFLGCLLTGLGLYQKLGNFAGAGSIVPITGFANSVSAPSLEYKKEGFIYGVGAKMFVIAGPVILYGTLTSFIVGLIYYILNYCI